MKAENYVSERLDKKYGIADLDGWMPNDVMQFADDFVARNNKQIKEVVLYGLSLIALSEGFDINLGQGWQNFKQMAKDSGIEYGK